MFRHDKNKIKTCVPRYLQWSDCHVPSVIQTQPITDDIHNWSQDHTQLQERKITAS